MSSITCCCKKLSFVFALLALAMMAAPAFAQGGPQNAAPNNCLLNEYQLGQGLSAACPAKDPLQCTANDVSISNVPVGDITILTNGTNNPPKCFQGQTFNFIAVFDIVTTSNSSGPGGRDNVGLYFAQPGNPNPFVKGKASPVSAECGNTANGLGCIDNIITPLHGSLTCPGGAGTCPGQFGSDGYAELDNNGAPGPDNCGDTTASDFSPAGPAGWNFGASAEGVAIEVDGFTCPSTTTALNSCTASDGTTGILMPYCTSWQTPGNTILCEAQPNDSYSSAAIPGTPSKCNCTTTCLPIQPINISVAAAKACNTSLTTTTRTYTFTGTPPAGTGTPNVCHEGVDPTVGATYGVAIDPAASTGGVVLDQICDSYFGTIATNFASSTCDLTGTKFASITAAGGSAGTCATAVTSGTIIASGNTSETCYFTAPALGTDINTVVDQVQVYVHSSVASGTTAKSPLSNSVTVDSAEAASSATATKSFAANEGACATVRYTAEVDNTSTSDETETLSKLTDSVNLGAAQDLTALGSGALGTVLGTNCNQTSWIHLATDTASDGTFGGSFGTLTAGTGVYKCQFDMQFCAATLDASGCFVTQSDVVTATLSGDEAGDSAIIAPSAAISVKECLSGTQQ